jgi:two-component system, NarL family, sensor histidine kinase UhpB
VSLRLQVNLIITSLMGIFAALLIWLQIDNTRRSVQEEMQGSYAVASQLLSRVNWIYGNGGLEGMRAFLNGIGRVRANEIRLFDNGGQELYRSPLPTYKAGKEAPLWFSALVAPPVKTQIIRLPAGRLELTAAPSRAILDGWDDLIPILWTILIGCTLGNILVFALIGRALKPFAVLTEGLQSIEQNKYHTRLPLMPGAEGHLVSHAFNRMAQSVEENAEAQRLAQVATLALAENREFTHLIQTRIEQERGAIARELHDEIGQQVTAIKSASLVIARRAEVPEATVAQAAFLVTNCADSLYDSMHRLVARLRPLALDKFGLSDALDDLLCDWRMSHPQVTFELSLSGPLETLLPDISTAIFRIVQESVNNALRHSSAKHIWIGVHSREMGLELSVRDDGDGQLERFKSKGHFGVLGMQERVHALNGEFSIAQMSPHGVQIAARFPFETQSMEML